MECLIYFGMTSMKEGTSAQLSGRGELHGGARVTTLVTLRKCTLGHKREIKTLKFVSASTKGFKGGLSLDQALQERHGSDFFLLVRLSAFAFVVCFVVLPAPGGVFPFWLVVSVQV